MNLVGLTNSMAALGQFEARTIEVSAPDYHCDPPKDSLTKSALQPIVQMCPDGPGVYLFRNREGMPIYIGKAKSLRRRLSSYLHPSPDRANMVAHLFTSASTIEILVTNTESEALDLENLLIKQTEPRYNVLLKDDKTYPYVKLTEDGQHLELSVTRRKGPDGATYYGPFFPATLAYEAVSVLRRHFLLPPHHLPFPDSHVEGLWDKGKGRSSFSGKRAVQAEVLKENARKVRKLLEGHTEGAAKEFLRQMSVAVKARAFDKAARLHNCARVLEKLRQQANAACTPQNDTDVVGFRCKRPWMALTVFQFRNGEIVGRYDVIGNIRGHPSSEGLPLALVCLVYSSCFISLDAILPAHERGVKIVEQTLSSACGRHVSIGTPARGPLRAWHEIANKNAKVSLEEWIGGSGTDSGATGQESKVGRGGPAACRTGWRIMNLGYRLKPNCKRMDGRSCSLKRRVFLAVRHNSYLFSTPYDFMSHRNRRSGRQGHFFMAFCPDRARSSVIDGKSPGCEADKVQSC
jgi:excinuclease UvrABC nuclease subunit